MPSQPKNSPVEQQTTTVRFQVRAKNVLMSPRKLRPLAAEIQNYSPLEALKRLKLQVFKKAKIFAPLLKNSLATAKNNYHIKEETLRIATIVVNEGIKLKRLDKSHGSRFNRGLIHKRRSHITITLEGKAPNGSKS